MKRRKLGRQRRGWALLLITTVLGSAITIVLTEFAVRLLFPENVPAIERVTFFQYDSLLGWSHLPGQRASLEQRDFHIEVSINSLGLRDDEYLEPKGNTKRMLVIGDSFAWGFGVEQEDRFSEILERAHPGWEIINAAVNGYGTDQELLYLRGHGLDLAPDVVLLLFHTNDFRNNTATEQYWYNKPRFIADGSQLVLENVPVPAATLEQHLRRFILGRTYLGQSMHRAWREIVAPDVSLARDPDRGVAAGGTLTARLLQEINVECQRRGARLVLVSVPMAEVGRSILAEVTTADDIDYLALDSAFALIDPVQATTFPNDEHWNELGHFVAALSIDRFLGQRGVFENDGPLD